MAWYTKHTVDDKPRCQSCGMPLGPGFYGTNASGSENTEYCHFCFRKGAFTDPDMTMEQMIQTSVDNMVKDQGMTPAIAKQLAHDVIPNPFWKPHT